MTYPDITPDLRAAVPELRGRLLANHRYGGADLVSRRRPGRRRCSRRRMRPISRYLLPNLPAEIPVTVVGLGSNLIVRDGGIPGVVIRLGGKAFGEIALEEGDRAAGRHGCARREGGARGGRCRARRARLLSRHSRLHRRRAADECRRAWRRDDGCAGRGARRRPARARSSRCRHADMGFTYRHSAAATHDIIFTSALFQGRRATRRRSWPRWTG